MAHWRAEAPDSAKTQQLTPSTHVPPSATQDMDPRRAVTIHLNNFHCIPSLPRAITMHMSRAAHEVTLSSISNYFQSFESGPI